MPNDLATAQNRNPVGNFHYLIELVSNVNNAPPLFNEPPNYGDQNLNFGRQQCSRRLIEDDEIRSDYQRNENFKPLPLPNGQIADQHVGLDCQADFLRRVQQFRTSPIAIEPDDVGLIIYEKIICAAQFLDKPVLLLDNTDSVRRAVLAARQFNGTSADLDVTCIRLENPAQNSNERRLAGTVFA